MPDVRIAVEPWASAQPECRALQAAHFAEVEGPLAALRPYRLNERLMQHAADAGFLHAVVARVDGVFVGYLTWTISDDPESTGTMKAEQGALYVDPSYARYRLMEKMVDFSIAFLRERGVKCLFMHHRMLGRGARLGLWFKRRLRAIETKREFFLWIGD